MKISLMLSRCWFLMTLMLSLELLLEEEVRPVAFALGAFKARSHDGYQGIFLSKALELYKG